MKQSKTLFERIVENIHVTASKMKESHYSIKNPKNGTAHSESEKCYVQRRCLFLKYKVTLLKFFKAFELSKKGNYLILHGH